MYGRACLDLLRKRVIHHSAWADHGIRARAHHPGGRYRFHRQRSNEDRSVSPENAVLARPASAATDDLHL